MKIKNCILSVALILGSCSDTVLVAQLPAKAEQVKEAESKYSRFKKIVNKCVRNWKGCTREERKEIIGYGLAALGAAAAIGTAGYYWRKKSREAAGAPGATPAGPAVAGRPAAQADPGDVLTKKGKGRGKDKGKKMANETSSSSGGSKRRAIRVYATF